LLFPVFAFLLFIITEIKIIKNIETTDFLVCKILVTFAQTKFILKTSKEILSDFNCIIRKVFSDDKIVISEKSVPKDITGWDSLMHLEIIAAIEEFYKIKFTFKEVMSFKNVGDIVNCTLRHLEEIKL
jgi:acyl carrier protein